MQPGQSQHDGNMRGYNGYMPSNVPYNMQQHSQVPNMNHRPGPGIPPMPQNIRSHSNPNMNSNPENHYMSSNPPQMQRSVTSPYGGPMPSPVMGMGNMGGNYQGDVMGLPPAHGGMHNSSPSGSGYSMPQSGRNESGMQYDGSPYPPQQHMQHQRYGMGVPFSQALGAEEQEFKMQNEDFPALPGSAGKGMQVERSENSSSNQQQQPAHTSPHNQPLKLGASPPSLVPSSPSQSASNQNHAGASTGYMSSRSESEIKYGLLGLLDVIKMTNRDLNTLALGSDLTSFGLNLNSTDCLYSNFTSPFSSRPVSSDPNFTTPSCYRMHPPTLKSDHLTKFQVETLFYMFYAMPRDVMQATAAQELYQREWRYHGEHRLWLKARSQQEMVQSNSKVQYLYFDVNSWEARLYTNAPTKGSLSAGFLPEEEILVKPSNMPQQKQQAFNSSQRQGPGSGNAVGVGNA